MRCEVRLPFFTIPVYRPRREGIGMRLAWSIVGLALCVAGCTSPKEERLQEYSSDGLHLFQHGDYTTARQDFEAALVLKPNDAGLQYDAGACYDRQGADLQAEKYYNECLRLAPNHPECHFALASLLIRSGRRAEAERLAADWLKREPKLADAYALVGLLERQAGDLPQAQVHLQAALELEPQNPRALVEMAMIYEAMQREDRAVVLYERVLQKDPNQPEVKQRLNGLLTRGTQRPQPE